MRNVAGACAAVLAVGLFALRALPGDGKTEQDRMETGGTKEIATFNRKFLDAHLKMDTPAMIRMWAEDGVSLLPETAPMVGKPEIVRFLGDVTERL